MFAELESFSLVECENRKYPMQLYDYNLVSAAIIKFCAIKPTNKLP